MRLTLIGRNSSFSPDAVQRLGSVYGLSPGPRRPHRHLPHTVSHSLSPALNARADAVSGANTGGCYEDVIRALKNLTYFQDNDSDCKRETARDTVRAVKFGSPEFSFTALQDLDRPGAVRERLHMPARGPLPPYSATMAESAPDRLGHCSSSRGGDICQVAPRRTEGNFSTRKARPQQHGSHGILQHRGLRSSPQSTAEADCSVLEFIFWACLLGALYAFVKWVHV